MSTRIDGKGYRVHCKARQEVYRPNKVAVHYQRKAKIKDGDLLTLAVRGTLDPLAARNGLLAISKKVLKEHPTERGYFKEVYILSKQGQWNLKMKRRHNTNQQTKF